MMTDIEKKCQKKGDYNGYTFDTPFIQKIFEAMDETERNRLSPEKTEQMLRKISFAAARNSILGQDRDRFKNRPIIFEKQHLCTKGLDEETK